MSPKRDAFVKEKLRHCNVQHQITLDKLSPELEKLKGEVDILKSAYINDNLFGLLVTMTTRRKIHEQLQTNLEKLRRHEFDLNLTRLERLVPLHLKQIRWMGGENLEGNSKFYNNMLHTLEEQARLMKALQT